MATGAEIVRGIDLIKVTHGVYPGQQKSRFCVNNSSIGFSVEPQAAILALVVPATMNIRKAAL